MLLTNIKNLIFISVLCETTDTKIIQGTYYGYPCIIKQIQNDDIFGIKAKTLREICTLKKNKHNNIVRLYGVKYDENHVYLILEKGDKNLLSLTQNEMADENIIMEIVSGLKSLHLKNYIHGDLSLKNVVKFNSGKKIVYKLIDLGLSTKTYRTSAVSVPTMYISPMEILYNGENNSYNYHKFQKISPNKLDSWALGCLLYYVITGDILFIDENNDKLMKQIADRLDIDFGNIHKQKCQKHKKYSIGKSLRNHTSNNKIIKSIKSLLNVNIRKRSSVSDFYINDFDKDTCYDNNFVNESEIFKPDNNNCNNLTRSKLMQIFFYWNIKFNIPIENVFMTFKLLHKFSFSESEYILNGIILYSLTTKLVSHVEISLKEVIEMINVNCFVDITPINNISELNKRIYSLIEMLNWDLDSETLISHVCNVPEINKMNYLVISLVMLFDVKYDVFSADFGYKMITILLQCIDDVKFTFDIENKYRIFHVCNDIFMSLHNINDNNLIQGQIIKTYFQSIGIIDFSKWVSQFNTNKLFKKLI